MPSLRTMIENGLRPENWMGRNSPYLVKCRNRRPVRDGGLKGFFGFTPQASDAAIAATPEVKAWPFPQVFEGKSIHLLAFQDSLYTIDPTDGSITIVDTKDPNDATGGTSKAIEPGYDWHFLDFGNSWMLLNGVSVVWQKHGGYIWTSDDVTINTGCVHMEGRALLAGFDDTNYYARVDWPAYWAEVNETMPDEYSSLAQAGLGGADVWYSSFLAPDLFHLLDGEDLQESGMALDLRIRREAGSVRMPWIGTCVGLAELGSGVVLYGTGGVHFLEPFNNRYARRDFVGMGEKTAVLPGTDTRTHFAGNKSVQYFVDDSFVLWRLTPNLQAEALGFSEYLSTLDRDTMLATYDGANDQLYIADGTRCWLYTQGRMCEAPYMPTRITAAGRSSIRSIFLNATDTTTVEVETGTLTTESGGIETLSRIWVRGLTTNASTGWRVKVKYRLRVYDDWTESEVYTPDARGVVSIAIPVLEFRLVLTSTNQAVVTADDLGYEFSDMNAAFGAKLAAATPGAATE